MADATYRSMTKLLPIHGLNHCLQPRFICGEFRTAASIGVCVHAMNRGIAVRSDVDKRSTLPGYKIWVLAWVASMPSSNTKQNGSHRLRTDWSFKVYLTRI